MSRTRELLRKFYLLRALAFFFFLTISLAPELFLLEVGCLGLGGLAAYADTPVKIGVVAPLTGTKSSIGNTVKNSVTLASSRFNPSGEVKFIFEDDQFLPRNTVSAVSKLLLEDKVDGLLVYGSHTALAVSPLVETAKRPMIAFSIVERLVQGKEFTMKHWVPARTEQAALAEEVKRRGYKRVAIVTMQNDAMYDLRQLFRDSKLAEIVLDEDFPPDNIDFRPTCARIKALNPDAVYNLLWAPQPAVFSKQLRAHGYEGAFFGAHNFEDMNEVKASQGALVGAWFVTLDDRGAGEYFKSYTERFSSYPTAGGVNAFDAAKMMIEGAKSTNLNTYLHTLKDFDGALGKYSASASNDFEIRAMLKVVGEGGFSPLTGN